ncbi:ATP-binding cassette domain-containing protein [Streptomyces fradiae]|uniref:ABC transporter ATP-binding protein n=1 Tax=Streptomyces fradiae TaxID=1906 RepID=UPI0033D01956
MPLHYNACTFGYQRRSRPVLDGLTLHMPPGNTVLLGPNGAGKSTLLSLGASATHPSSGRVAYRGLNPAVRRQRGPYRQAVAWLPQKPDFLPGMTCREHVAYAGWLKGMSEKAAWNAAPKALERVGLQDRVRHKITRLSGGQQQRVAIAQALVHRAEVLLLDEPTVGLDPQQRETFMRVLNDLRGSVHVILSTHDVADLDTTFDHVVVLSEGRIRFSGTMDEFTAHAESGCAPGRRLTSAYISLIGGAAC